jgi:hypothetical protein
MQALAVPLQGFLNAIVYGLNRHLRAEYRACCGFKPPAEKTDPDHAYQPQENEEDGDATENAAYASGQTNSPGYGSTDTGTETFFVKVARFD